MSLRFSSVCAQIATVLTGTAAVVAGRCIGRLAAVVLFCLSGSISGSAGPVVDSGNVLLGRPYTLSSQPNYGAATAAAKTVLTDGLPATNWFIRDRSALGWSWRTPVVVSTKLSGPRPIDRVVVQAGGKLSGSVYFPSQLLVYGGNAAGRYAFLGSSTLQRDGDSPRHSQTRNFEIRFAARTVHEVVVVAYARGAMLFLGEIQAFAALKGAELKLDIASMPALLADGVTRRRQKIAALPGAKPVGLDPSRRFAMPLMDDPRVQAAAHGAAQATEHSPERQPSSGCAIQRVEPWPETAGAEQAIAPDTGLMMMAGGDDYAAFQITNHGAAETSVAVATVAKQSAKSETFALSHAQALNYRWIADATVPIDGAARLPARSRMIMLVRVSHARAGMSKIAFRLNCGATQKTFAANMTVMPADAAVHPVHGNLWAYLHEKQHASVTKTLACDPDFLDRYGVDVAVIHPSALFAYRGRRQTELLSRYFRSFRKTRMILLSMDVKSRPWAFKGMSDIDAQRSLGAWWQWLQSVAKREGVTGELVLYPIDEPVRGDVWLLRRTIRLLRAAGVTARSYATVGKDVAPFLTSLDILQFLQPTRFWREILKVGELHTYATEEDGRLLSPNRYYRMQGWRAFAFGLTGVGVWSAWDTSGLDDPQSGWNPFSGERERDFGLVYLEPNGCGWPSRRLLAWKRGIDENRMMRTCIKRNGIVLDKAARLPLAAGSSRDVRAALEKACRT